MPSEFSEDDLTRLFAIQDELSRMDADPDTLPKHRLRIAAIRDLLRTMYRDLEKRA